MPRFNLPLKTHCLPQPPWGIDANVVFHLCVEGYLLEQAWSQDTWAYHITEVGVAALDWLPVFMPKWGSDGTWNWGLCLKGWSRDAVAGVGGTQPLVFPTPGRWGHRESWWRCLFAVEKWWLFLWKILAGHSLSKKTHERSRWLIHQHAQFWKQLQELPKFVVSGCGALSWPQGLMTRILEEYDVHTGWPRNLLCFFVYGIIVKPNTHTQTYTNYKSPHTHMKPRITFQPTHPKRKWRRTQGSQRTDVADVEVVNWWSRSWHIPFWRRCFPGCGKGAKRWNPLQLHIEKLLI